MKVSQKEAPFQPITITLETKRDAELMVHITNCAFEKSLATYAEQEGLDRDELSDFHYKIWEELDKRFKDY